MVNTKLIIFYSDKFTESMPYKYNIKTCTRLTIIHDLMTQLIININNIF